MNGQRAQPMDPRRAIDALSTAVTAELLRAERRPPVRTRAHAPCATPGPDRGVLPSMFRFVMVALAGTVLVTECVGRGVPPVVAELEVFNRTVEDLLYVAADGEVLEVPACGNAADPTFRIDAVSVRAAGGFVRGFGGDFSHAGRQRLVLVEVARAANSGLPEPAPPPDPLPPCEGLPEAQPGT